MYTDNEFFTLVVWTGVIVWACIVLAAIGGIGYGMWSLVAWTVGLVG